MEYMLLPVLSLVEIPSIGSHGVDFEPSVRSSSPHSVLLSKILGKKEDQTLFHFRLFTSQALLGKYVDFSNGAQDICVCVLKRKQRRDEKHSVFDTRVRVNWRVIE